MQGRRTGGRAMIEAQARQQIYRFIADDYEKGIFWGRGQSSQYGNGTRQIAEQLNLDEPSVKAAMMAAESAKLIEWIRNDHKGRGSHWRPAAEPTPQQLDDLAVLPVYASSALSDRLNTQPHTRLEWALYWARKGVMVFPCESWLGTPLEAKWHRYATTSPGRIVEWWTQFPDADIGAVPERNRCYAIVARGEQGVVNLLSLEDEVGGFDDFITYETRWKELFVWLKGSAFSGPVDGKPGLEVVGSGRFVFLPPSLAEQPIYKKDARHA